MSNTFCYWSVADGNHGKMMASAIYSARQVGVTENFHIWSDAPVPGAITHDCGQFDKAHYMFKLDFLKNQMHKLFYDYYIFLDADTWFVRHPGDILKYCKGDPVHICMESNCDNPEAIRGDWWNCPLGEFCSLMREKGVRCNKIFNNNAGMWIVHRDAVEAVHRLSYEFWHFAKGRGYTFTEEAALAFAAHLLMGDPYKHQLIMDPDFWASDWMGHFTDRIPIDEEWEFKDYMTMEPIKVRPAIVHAMRSKNTLVKFSETL